MATNALLDIWSGPHATEVVEILRKEAEQVYEEHNGEWSKLALSKLIRLDSAIRESSRVSGVGGTALARKVKVDEGIVLPNRLWVPKGVTVGVSMDGIHFDESLYERPTEFDPFRFSRAKEKLSETSDKPRKNEGLVNTSAQWLPFSHGIHAWYVNLFLRARIGGAQFQFSPGRFFAANNIKMVLAHILLNYDIQPFTHRPHNISLGDISVVPVKAKMMVKPRERKA